MNRFRELADSRRFSVGIDLARKRRLDSVTLNELEDI